MKDVLVSNFKNSDFYSYLKDNKSYYPCRVLLILAPYFAEIAFVIGSSINIYFEVGQPVSQYRYYCASIISQIIAIILLLFWLFINNEPANIYKTYEFVFLIFIFLRFLLTLFQSQSYSSLSGLWTVISWTGIAAGIVFALVRDNAGKNSIYRILYSDGYFQEDGKYVVSIGIMDNKKIINAFAKTMMGIFTASIIIFTWEKLLGPQIQDLLPGDKSIVTKPQNQAALEKDLNKSMPIEFIFNVLVVAPILEELLFRQLIMRILGANIPSVFISTLIFSITHLSYNEPFHILFSYMAPAFTLSIAYYKYKNISINMMLHFIWNLLALIGMMWSKT